MTGRRPRAAISGPPRSGRLRRLVGPYGAYLSAAAFASAGAGLHHKIRHVLGGMYNLPHAQTHAVVLPYVLAFNAPHAPEACWPGGAVVSGRGKKSKGPIGSLTSRSP
ncbi:iron-containing alcohol dehydrogenase [Amycolatopsis speibonae]|uniref:Iron-containing alcohol dehydrogenase n=1 Tax=Amycolatopsis speibonae TaxID=1450224 RepID=A0ABV7NNU7_9PSEU